MLDLEDIASIEPVSSILSKNTERNRFREDGKNVHISRWVCGWSGPKLALWFPNLPAFQNTRFASYQSRSLLSN